MCICIHEESKKTNQPYPLGAFTSVFVASSNSGAPLKIGDLSKNILGFSSMKDWRGDIDICIVIVHCCC